MNIRGPQQLEFNPGSWGVLEPGPFYRVRAILWAIFLFLVVLGLFFASIYGATWLGRRGVWFYAPAIALPAFGCFIYAVLVRRLEKRRAFEIAMTFHSLRDGFAGVVMGAAYITSMWLLLWILQLYSVHRGVWTL
jgi:hypothetical protein